MVKYPHPQAKSKSHLNHSHLDQEIIRPDQAKPFHAFIPRKVLQSYINDNYSMETAVLHPKRLGSMNRQIIEIYMLGISR
jgi:hypothetical protein